MPTAEVVVETLTGIGLLCVAAILFYKFVDRKHKIQFFKVSIALGALSVVLLIGFAIFKKWNDAREEAWLRIKFSGIRPEISIAERHRLAEQAFKNAWHRFDWYLNKIPGRYEERVKTILLWDYLDASKGVTLREASLPEGNPILISLLKTDQDLFWKHFKSEISQDEYDRTLAEIELKMVQEYHKLIKSWPIEEKIWGFRILGWEESLSEPVRSTLLAPLSTRQRNELNTAKDIRNFAINFINSELNKDTRRQTSISFEICNNRNVALNAANFNVVGLENGRSTENRLEKNLSMYDIKSATEFKSDIIIAANSCKTVTWTGYYKIMDSYVLTFLSGDWRDRVYRTIYRPDQNQNISH